MKKKEKRKTTLVRGIEDFFFLLNSCFLSSVRVKRKKNNVEKKKTQNRI